MKFIGSFQNQVVTLLLPVYYLKVDTFSTKFKVKVKVKSASSQVAHTDGAHPSFRSIKQLEVFLLPLDGMLVHHRVTPQHYFASTHVYTRVQRSTI